MLEVSVDSQTWVIRSGPRADVDSLGQRNRRAIDDFVGDDDLGRPVMLRRPGVRLHPDRAETARAQQIVVLEREVVEKPDSARPAIYRSQQAVDCRCKDIASERAEHMDDAHIVRHIELAGIGGDELNTMSLPGPSLPDIPSSAFDQILGKLDADNP